MVETNITIRIRQAKASDETLVKACAEEAYEKYVAAIGQKPAPMIADFAVLISSGFAYVAVSADAEVVGFIIFMHLGDATLLENVAVRSSLAGQGIGKKLIAFCEAEAKRSGSSIVKLYTNAKMIENLSIYPHLGYRETDRRIESGFDRVFFEKTL